MKYIVGITEIEFYTKQNEILAPQLRFYEGSVRVIKVQSEEIENRYTIGSERITDKESKLKAITEYVRTLKSFNTEEEAEAYKKKVTDTLLKLLEENNIEKAKAYIKTI